MRRNGRFRDIAALASAAGLVAALTLAVPGEAPAAGNAAYFVKRGATAATFFADRDACQHQAASLGDSPDAYSDPRYGALRAMDQVIDSDALHGGDLRKRMLAAVFKDCMTRLDWSPLDPAPDDHKALRRASRKHPEALDAWLKAHEPPVPTPPVPVPPAAPAAASAPPQPR